MIKSAITLIFAVLFIGILFQMFYSLSNSEKKYSVIFNGTGKYSSIFSIKQIDSLSASINSKFVSERNKYTSLHTEILREK